MLEHAGNFAQRNVRSDERDCDVSAGQAHREIFYTTALGKKFRLAREFEPRLVHACFVHGPGDDCMKVAAADEGDGFLQRSGGGA